MSLISREHYIKQINAGNISGCIPIWSEPRYQCPKCGGGMRKNLQNSVVLACNPPITEYEYKCDNPKCSFMEYLRG